MKVDRK